jgi:hypothetical protein
VNKGMGQRVQHFERGHRISAIYRAGDFAAEQAEGKQWEKPSAGPQRGTLNKLDPKAGQSRPVQVETRYGSSNGTGSVRDFVRGRAVSIYQANAIVRPLPKRTTNWALAVHHSRGGMTHSSSERFQPVFPGRSGDIQGACPDSGIMFSIVSLTERGSDGGPGG